MWLLKPGVDTAEVRPSEVLPIHALTPSKLPNNHTFPLGVRLVVPSATNELVDVLRIRGAGDRFVTQGFGQLGSTARPSSLLPSEFVFLRWKIAILSTGKPCRLVMTTMFNVLHQKSLLT